MNRITSRNLVSCLARAIRKPAAHRATREVCLIVEPITEEVRSKIRAAVGPQWTPFTKGLGIGEDDFMIFQILCLKRTRYPMKKYTQRRRA